MPDMIPGVYTTYNRESAINGTAPNNRVLIWGYVLPGAPAVLNQAFQVLSGSELDRLCGGAGAHLAREVRAAMSMPESSGAEIWAMPIADPAGTPGTRLMKFMASPTYDASKGWILGTNTSASQASDCTVDVAGQVKTFSFAASASFSTIAAACNTALGELGAALTFSSGVSTDTVTLTDRHGAALTDELPIKISFSNPNCGVSVSAGTLTLATNSSADVNVTIDDGIVTVTAAIANGDTPAQASPKVRNALNATGAYRGAVADPVSGVLTIFYRDDRYARRLSASIGAGNMTAVLAAGTAGAGSPTVTTAMSNLVADQAYKVWAFPFNDTSSLGSAASHIKSMDSTPVEKGQVLVTAISTALPASALPAATTPALTSTELTTVLHYQGAPVRSGEIAARVATHLAASAEPARNWNGLRLLGTVEMPLAVPHRADRSTRDNWNTAIRAGYAPVAVGSDNIAYVVSARTTYASVSPLTAKLMKWSGAMIPIHFRASLRQRLSDRYFRPGKGKSLKAYGNPRTERAVNAKGVRATVIGLIKEWDAQDLFDYSADIDGAVRVEVPSTGVIRVAMPFRHVSDLDRIEIESEPA